LTGDSSYVICREKKNNNAFSYFLLMICQTMLSTAEHCDCD